MLSEIVEVRSGYQVRKVFCGHEQAKYQSTFCDELLGFADTQAERKRSTGPTPIVRLLHLVKLITPPSY